MKKMYLSLLAMISFVVVASTALAGTAIVDSLQNQGIDVQAITDNRLDEVRGTAVIIGQPHPSVVLGLKRHFVTYKGWGSQTDYHSYNYIGGDYRPAAFDKYTFPYNGQNIYVAGDQWKADLISPPHSWNAANAQIIEYHYQAITANGPTPVAFRETLWNRPITKFQW